MSLQHLSRLVVLSCLALTTCAGISTPAVAQEPHKKAQIPVLVKPGYRLIIKCKFNAADENLLRVFSQADGKIHVDFNTTFGRTPPSHPTPGGGEWKSPVAIEPTIYYLVGQHKRCPGSQGHGEPWYMSPFKVFTQSETGALIGWKDAGGDEAMGNITVNMSLEKVTPP